MKDFDEDAYESRLDMAARLVCDPPPQNVRVVKKKQSWIVRLWRLVVSLWWRRR